MFKPKCPAFLGQFFRGICLFTRHRESRSQPLVKLCGGKTVIFTNRVPTWFKSFLADDFDLFVCKDGVKSGGCIAADFSLTYIKCKLPVHLPRSTVHSPFFLACSGLALIGVILGCSQMVMRASCCLDIGM